MGRSWDHGTDAATVELPPPVANDSPLVIPLVCTDARRLGGPLAEAVCADFEARGALGVQRYGQPLRVANGRRGMVDAYQELLDACDYLRQADEQGERVGALYDYVLACVFMVRGYLDAHPDGPAPATD